MKKKMV